MLTLKQIKENTEAVIERLRKKQFEAREAITEVLNLDEIRRRSQQELDASLSRQKALAKEIGDLMKQGAKEQAESIRSQVALLKEASKSLEEKKAEAEAKIREILLSVPNLPADIVPEGATAEDNVCVKTGGQMPALDATAEPHWELAKDYDLIDFELGVKISGAGFPVYKGYGARLQRALINFFLDNAREAGYLEVQPPYVVNEDSGYGTGQLPDKEGQMYHATVDNLYLIPTAEVPVTNIYRDVILEEKDLPVRNTAYSACFRREAGSYGKDVRGLNFTSALTYDFEVFSAAQKRWLEVSSVSNFESYQANRLRCRYRDAEQGVQLVHTLNGSALALPRIVAALLENNQTPEGIRIPEALRPYTGFDFIPRPTKK